MGVGVGVGVIRKVGTNVDSIKKGSVLMFLASCMIHINESSKLEGGLVLFDGILSFEFAIPPWTSTHLYQRGNYFANTRQLS